MFVYGVIILLVGLSLLTGAIALAMGLHRRYGLPYALLTVGILTYTGALAAQFALLQLVDRALLGVLPIGALAIGLTAGFAAEIARFLGFQFLARGVVTRPQAMMVGLGHALSEIVYPGVLALGMGYQMLGGGAGDAGDLGAQLSGALAEALNGLLPILMHMALSWLVLQAFLRGELYWLFVAIFAHAVIEMMAVMLGPSDAWGLVIWQAGVALLSVGVLRRVQPPESTT